MTKHPLRKRLTKSDWERIQKVIDHELDITLATLDEIEAANDVFYDAIAGSKQTHYGVTTVQ
jgi:histidine ammonia-lyase